MEPDRTFGYTDGSTIYDDRARSIVRSAIEPVGLQPGPPGGRIDHDEPVESQRTRLLVPTIAWQWWRAHI